jgi:hypothetical protein
MSLVHIEVVQNGLQVSLRVPTEEDEYARCAFVFTEPKQLDAWLRDMVWPSVDEPWFDTEKELAG